MYYGSLLAWIELDIADDLNLVTFDKIICDSQIFFYPTVPPDQTFPLG